MAEGGRRGIKGLRHRQGHPALGIVKGSPLEHSACHPHAVLTPASSQQPSAAHVPPYRPLLVIVLINN